MNKWKRELEECLKDSLKEISNIIGKGHREIVYQKALIEELRLKGYIAKMGETIYITYKDKVIGEMEPDIEIINHTTNQTEYIIECKIGMSGVKINDIPQLIKYLDTKNISNGMLISFNQQPLSDIRWEYLSVENGYSVDNVQTPFYLAKGSLKEEYLLNREGIVLDSKLCVHQAHNSF